MKKKLLFLLIGIIAALGMYTDTDTCSQLISDGSYISLAALSGLSTVGRHCEWTEYN